MEESNKINFVPCLKWVKRGVAKAIPDKVQLSEAELADIINKAKSDLSKEEIDIDNLSDEDVTEENNVVQESQSNHNLTQNDDEFNFASYDQEKDTPDALLGIANVAMFEPTDNIMRNRTSMTYDDSDSEKEDDLIKPSDNLILVGHVEGDASILEVYIFNEEEESLYVHHDMLLPSFPLCIEWLNFDPSDSQPGNLCAIGSMSPLIEVWDLDIVDCLESAFALGEKPKRKKSNRKKTAGLRRGHTDAVLDLAWNESYNHVLASCSVDQSVMLWDLNTGKPSVDIRIFGEKVQSLQWHPFEASTLLVGSCDKYARVFDCRTAIDDVANSFKSWLHESEIEKVVWNYHEPFTYLTGSSDGTLSCIDCRSNGFVWSFKAHEKEITGIAVNPECPGLITTVANDGKMATWDLYDDNMNGIYESKIQPILIKERVGHLGCLQCLDICPDNSFTLAAGGDKKNRNFSVYDLKSDEEVAARFGKRKLVQRIKQEIDNSAKGHSSISGTTSDLNNLSIKKLSK